MKKLGGFVWFGLAVGVAAIIFLPLMKMVVGGGLAKIGMTGAEKYVEAA